MGRRRLQPPPGAEGESCQLVGGFFEVVVQMFLLVSALASLWVKRRFEKPRRVRVVWLCDVTKQCVGGSYIHVANMVASAFIAANANAGGGDPCAFYFVNFFVDCTLGVAVVAGVHEATRKLVRKCAGDRRTDLDVIGDYGAPPSKKVFLSQLACWLFALTVNKGVVAAVLYVARAEVTAAADYAFAPMREKDADFELVFVMVLAPWALTTLQFQVFDRYLKGPVRRDAGLVDDISEIPLLTAFPTRVKSKTTVF